MLEMKIVLRAVLAQNRLETVAPGEEGARRRGITVSPRAGSRAVLRARRESKVPAAA
jgi:cytochrome P450